MTGNPEQSYEFGPFTLDAAEQVLRQDGQVVSVRPKDLELLRVLVENNGRLVEKDELLKRVWPNSFVEEANLSQHVFSLRKLLRDDKETNRYIETVPRRGYRFVASVTTRPQPGIRSLAASPGVTEAVEAGPPVPSNAPQTIAADAPIASRTEAVRLRHRSSAFVALTAVLALGVTAIIYSVVYREQPRAAAPHRHVIAVLPFKALTRDQRDEALEMGMADTLITKLGSISDLTTRPIGAVRQYTGPAQDPVAAGRALRVESVLDGSIQRSGGRIRVTVRLLRVEDGATLWSARFDEPFTDIFAVQDAISEQVTRSLRLRLSVEDERRLTKRYTDNIAAYELYLKGRFFWNKRSDEGMKTAIDYFRQAVVAAPDYALAYSGLADTYALLSTLVGVAPTETFPQARRAAESALALDDTLAEAHTSLAFVKEAFDWDWAGAERAYQRALELDPNYASAHHRYGVLLCVTARCDEGLTHLLHARQLDPTSMIINADVGLGYYIARRYDEAIDQLRKAIELHPLSVQPRFYLVDCLVQRGLFNEALEQASKVSELSQGRAASALAFSYAAAGRRRDAEEILRDLTAQARRAYVSPLAPAAAYAALGDYDTAFTWLEKGVDLRAYVTVRIVTDSRFDKLRSHDRYRELVRRMGFPQ